MARRTSTAGINVEGGLRFDTIQLALEAAVMGLGVALGRRPLVDRDLATNALIEASPHTITAATVYWLVSADHTTQRPDLLGFRQWLLEEAEHFEDDPATHTAQDQTEPDDR